MIAVIEYIKANPGATKANISESTGIKGLPLFNLLKKMVNDGQITIEGEGNDSSYYVATIEAPAEEYVQDNTTRETSNNEEISATEGTDKANEETGEQTQQGEKEQTPTETKPAKKQVGRNTGTFLFNGTSYNKGKLINAVVSAYCAKNKSISLEKLRLVFPDSLLKRFGIFQTVEKAREISGAKYDRYFFKEEFQIKLKDCVIVTCNQITGENLVPFLEQCAKLNLVIEAE